MPALVAVTSETAKASSASGSRSLATLMVIMASVAVGASVTVPEGNTLPMKSAAFRLLPRLVTAQRAVMALAGALPSRTTR